MLWTMKLHWSRIEKLHKTKILKKVCIKIKAILTEWGLYKFHSSLILVKPPTGLLSTCKLPNSRTLALLLYNAKARMYWILVQNLVQLLNSTHEKFWSSLKILNILWEDFVPPKKQITHMCLKALNANDLKRNDQKCILFQIIQVKKTHRVVVCQIWSSFLR